MKKTEYNKLVRDGIPGIIESSGKKAVVQTLDGEAFLKKLHEKLAEELAEYLESGSVEELADMGEVMHAILAYKNVSIEEFQCVRMEKRGSRGGFEKRLLLKEVVED